MSLPLPMQADTNRRGQPVLLDDWIAIKLRGIEAGFKEHLNCDVLACWKIIRNNPNYPLHKLKRRIREEVVRLCAPWSWEKRMTSIIHPRFGPLPVRPEKRLPRSIGASWQFHKKGNALQCLWTWAVVLFRLLIQNMITRFSCHYHVFAKRPLEPINDIISALGISDSFLAP